MAKKNSNAKLLITISLVPNRLKKAHSHIFQRGGDVSFAIILIISGSDFMERIAENPSSPHMLVVNWFMAEPVEL